VDPFRTSDLIAVPLRSTNIDTDQIVPARFLLRPRKAGFGDQLFHDLRYLADGTMRDDFIMNLPAYQGAGALVVGRNFGSGSSRESAVWALMDYGIRIVVASEFGDIFFNNCFKTGLLPIVLTDESVVELQTLLEREPGRTLRVNLDQQILVGPDGYHKTFDVDPFRKQLLLDGMDEISFTCRHREIAAAFERNYEEVRTWLARPR
jgi:3-isopropylmalate/(R)-2-methylmalate dehydratase small subunit